MTGQVRIFMNEVSVSIPSGSTVATALELFDASLGAALAEGTGYLTDGVGRRLSPDTVAEEGMIVRAIAGRPPSE
jgi:hypothetical protein